jgi:hypothetical protein
MIKLTNLLKEITNPTPDTLYHFTLPKFFINIINSNTLQSDSQFNQISFTSDPDLWAFREFPEEDQEIGVRLTFNSKDLPPLKSFIYKGHPDDDYEYEKEYISTSGNISNINNKIKEITAINYYKDYLKQNLSEKIFNKIKFI